MAELSIEDRVNNGIELLDAKGPMDWRDRIDADSLDVASVDHCPLTQVFGGYTSGCHALSIGFAPGGEASKHGFEHNFRLDDFADGSDITDDYSALTDEWYRRLT